MREWVRSFIAALPVMLYDWLALDKQPCHAFGGVRPGELPDPMVGMEVRVCTKSRWHTDSHAYEFVKFPYTYPKEGK